MASTWPESHGAAELVNAYRERRADPRVVLEEHLQRIDTWNPVVNAMVADRRERARAEADAAWQALSNGEDTRPLLGVPVTIKEFLQVEGMPNTAGLVARRGTISSQDAVSVARLRAAGAIVIGVTNGPEGGLWAETTNKVYGRTNNPWNPAHTCGGSSGGEAALLAVGGAALGLGSDIGGSVRIPAGWSGITAHKPTGRLVPTAGHTPANPSAFLCVGPMAPRVADLALALPILAGPHPTDPTAVHMPLGDPRSVRPDRLTVLVPEEALAASTKDVVQATEAAAQVLSDAGASVQRISLPPMARAFNIWLSAMASAGFPSYAEILGDGEPTPVFMELARALVGGGRHTLPPLLVSLTESLSARLPILDLQAELAHRDALAADLDQRLGPHSVLLLPTTTRPAPRHNGLLLHFSATGLCGVFNVLELPSTQVPAGFSTGGLPIGVQLVGGKAMDHVCLAAAAVVEAGLGGWRPPDSP